ncbi:hypothetical protein Z517_09472 [Fonsecaea pedrosoi CBS 271.37]|uniref:Zn(2)-C6 fungal-type domain-containing protein n=1 Tax=Fonsecaea pedrosoi CBS 271.37 TaxID=1442368 RepID=A0A0D2DH77_9EURO|nr:uncharacterized protein Z517_09472 [Fonsecaea pedrosoi CBS 271.37]KIW77026.1 hypothetical protein Z517_09472 [Fonsecaea pedrosoi CBS 271.37]
MAKNIVAHRRHIQSKPKVKTGCGTCRIRKVKCDENKPSCHKCVHTGRVCDGYASLFRFCSSKSTKNARGDDGIKSSVSESITEHTGMEISPHDIDLLNRYFSTKTMFDVKLDCDEEAKQVLQASLTDPSIRHAVSSLRALREDRETTGDVPASAAQQTPSHDYGLQQYCMALGGLASTMSLGTNGLRSALLCCQIFISIEQVRENYAVMAQHLVRGLGIMREHRARPTFDAANELTPAHPDQLPFLDVFIIKLFAAPCRFAEPAAPADTGVMTLSESSVSPPEQHAVSRNLRTIAPDMRTELARIASSTLEFLGQVSRVDSTGAALRLRSQKATLLDSLASWLAALDPVQAETTPPRPELLSVSFLRLFHLILRIVLLGSLDCSPEACAALQTENERLQCLASQVDGRVKAYRSSGGTR